MVLEQFSLDGTVAIVTGGSRGIGEEIAVAMAEAGSDVVPVARSKERLERTVERIEAMGSETLLLPGDVTDRDGVEALFEEVRDGLGPVDILVNNAGVNTFSGMPEDLDLETWEQTFAVNVTGAFNCAQQFGRQVIDRDGTGVVLNVASVSGVIGLPYQTPYTASKHALVGMTKTMAIDWAPDIRVNALAPGYVETELTEGVREKRSLYESLLSEIPQDRFADPEEIAASAVYLVSDAASYATGEVHLVDGGMTAR